MKRRLTTVLLTCACALSVAACDSDDSASDMTSTADVTSAPDTATDDTTPAGDTTAAGDTTTAADTTAVPSDATSPPDLDQPDMMMPPADVMMMPALEAHGCTFATATDMTGMGAVALDDWGFGHNRCVIVDVGTAVTWNGNLASHPLGGGVAPTTDAANPIQILGATSGQTATVDFTAPGDFPYFCLIHTSMQGVIYVR